MVQGPSREEDPLKQLADKLRAKNGVEWRSSILQDQRVEFIRGKDLARYLRSHEEQLQPFVSKGVARCPGRSSAMHSTGSSEKASTPVTGGHRRNDV